MAISLVSAPSVAVNVTVAWVQRKLAGIVVQESARIVDQKA